MIPLIPWAMGAFQEPTVCRCGAAWPCRQHANPRTYNFPPSTREERRAENERRAGKGKSERAKNKRKK